MKRLISLFVLAALVLALPITVLAENGNVRYTGDSGSIVFAPGSDYSPTDLFPNFKDVMPGDTLSQSITVKNDASNKVKVKIYLRALGAQEGSQEFLSQLRLRVEKNAENDMAYMFDAAASESAQLDDWVCLGTLYSGGTVNLEVLLSVPQTMGNEFKNQAGYLDWEFKIEEFPVEDTDPVTPETGDPVPLGVLIGALAVSAAGLLLIIFLKKRQKETN